VRDLVPKLEQHWFDVYGRIARTGETLRFDNEVAALGRWYDVCAFRVGAPELLRVGVVFNDITARKRAEQALRDADRRKDEFLATLAHELRNPLAPLRNAVQLLRAAAPADREQAQAGEIMERQLNHVVRLVDDLHEMARISRGALELRSDRVELKAIVRSAVEASEPLIAAARHRFELSLPVEPLWLEGDGVRLAQIVSNLLNNAAKYTPDGGVIRLQARCDAAQATIAVRDNGPGIPAESLSSIFEMFSRGTWHGEQRQSGLGIGLALSRRLAEMHGGAIEAQSEGIGKGSEFIVRLPIASVQAPQTSASAAVLETLPPVRILVVDDNRDAAASLGMLLRTLGAEVRVEHDGPAAIEAFGAYDPAIALLDVGMPGMSGYDLARALRKRDADRRTTLVALTGWGQDEDRRRAHEAGFDHHLVKPTDVETLQRLIGEVSESRGAQPDKRGPADRAPTAQTAAQAGPQLGD
jgi:signal transduction histidine kinase/FixJ family two-component response regulator